MYCRPTVTIRLNALRRPARELTVYGLRALFVYGQPNASLLLHDYVLFIQTFITEC